MSKIEKILKKHKIDTYAEGIGDGWSDLIDKLITELKAAKWDGYVAQMKEKFGGLRFYIGAGSDEIFDIITKYENLSEETCMECGEPGTISKWGKGWYLCLCEKHGKEREND